MEMPAIVNILKAHQQTRDSRKDRPDILALLLLPPPRSTRQRQRLEIQVLYTSLRRSASDVVRAE
jgi:hypothetical protein